MHTTSQSLLIQLQAPDQPLAWERFVQLYTPLLLTWGRKAGLQPQDAADLVQDVFATLVRQLPKFQYDPEKKNFRGWLRTICLNKWRDRQRLRTANMANAADADLAALPSPEGADAFWEHEHQAYLVRQALACFEELKSEFDPQTLQCCLEVVVRQRPVADVAADLGLSKNAVYIAKLHVLRRVREVLADFLD